MAGPVVRKERSKHRNSGPINGAAGQGRGAATRVPMRLEKSLGQHMMKNPGILDKIVAAACIKSSDVVLEIGPGTGNLTMRILPLARKVIAFDIDGRMVNEVKKKAFSLGFKNLEAKEGDALRSQFDKFDVCTANLPYQISSPFVFRLLAHRPLFRCAVLMFQKEFAERLLADPGSAAYCRLSVNAQLFCKISKVCKVAPGSFNPPPRVESMVVKLTPREPQPKVNFREWDGLVRICFHRKNRTLRAGFNNNGTLKVLESNFETLRTLSGAPQPSVPFKELIFEALGECGLANKRGSDLCIEDIFQLLLAFNKRGIHFVGTSSAMPTPSAIDNCPKLKPETEYNPLEGVDEFMFADNDP